MIPCTEQCIYQRDGTCRLRRAATGGDGKNAASSCAHYIEKRGGSR
ncbi:MAG: hypothetical protein LBN99_00705 [Oscillospiraceae bacterium]|jgi:hypothetical protein|nr:hypothetical protein [Oscillospiraceae bacterium]